MFGLLKNKLAGFIKGLTGGEEKKQAPSETPAPVAIEKKPEARLPEKKKAEPMEEKRIELPVKEKTIAPPAEKKIVVLPVEKKREAPQPQARQQAEPKQTPEKPKVAPQKPEQKKQASEPKRQEQSSVSSQKPEQKKPETQPHEQPIVSSPKPEQGKPAPEPQQKKPAPSLAQSTPVAQHPSSVQEEKTPEHSFDLSALSRRAPSDKREIAPKIGLGATIKSFFSSEVTIGEAEVSGLLSELELSLLEADVEYGVSMEVSSQLRSRLVGMRVPKGEVAKKTREAISQVLESIMDSDLKFDFVKRVQETEKPAKILFVGPNGAGKTTTMAKISRMLSEHGMTSVFSASDTFRAAAIEQTEVHGERLGVKVIKSKYGADPSSVAFDAVNYARSHNIDVVLIDSAGRQDTNANLLSELKKINRVAKPDIKLYIGESISGNALIDQIKAFQEAIGIDGAILTKLDCDSKGGTAISITKATGIPIIFLGVGQRYEDLVPFDPHKIAQEIMT